MDLIHQVVVNIEAAKLGEAQSLINALEAHRDAVKRRPGFLDMQIKRAVEAGGETQLTVETRWRTSDALADYTQGSDNVQGIVESHGDTILGDTLRVRRLESLESAAPVDKSKIVYERFATALMVPLVIVGIGLAIIYMLSRVYLEISGGGATFLAVVIAAAILLIAAFFATNPKLGAMHMAGAVGIGIALLLGGTVYAAVHPGPDREATHSPTPEGTPGDQPTPPPPGDVFLMDDNVFDTPNVIAPAGVEKVFEVHNRGAALHNVHVAVDGYDAAICRDSTSEPCSDPARINGGRDGTITINLAAGTYDFRCDFHPDEMQGTLTVQ